MVQLDGYTVDVPEAIHGMCERGGGRRWYNWMGTQWPRIVGLYRYVCEGVGWGRWYNWMVTQWTTLRLYMVCVREWGRWYNWMGTQWTRIVRLYMVCLRGGGVG